jgi:tetratricopeptide (TPR) repeat protein
MKIPPRVRGWLARLWSANTLKFGVSAIACLLAMSIQVQYRVPGRFVFLLLPWVGLAVGALSFIVLFHHLLARLREGATVSKALGRMQWWAGILVRVFVYYSLFLYANGKLDRSMPVDRPAEVREVSGGEMDLGWLIPYAWAELRLRDDPAQPIRILLEGREMRGLWGGDAVVVQERAGYFGLPWVSRIERDREHYAREALKLMPTAAAAWKDLVTFYFERQRWPEAHTAAREYLKRYPRDYDFVFYTGGELAANGRYAEGIPLLELVVERKPTYEAHQTLGWALSYAGNNPRAAQVLEASIPMNPDDFEAYYHLGYVYSGLGRYADAIAMFEKVLERRPSMPEAEAEIAKLRKLLANQGQTGQRKP